MIDPLVRPADAGDAEQLRSLEAEARAALLQQRGGERWLATHPARNSTWESCMVGDAQSVWVAHIGDVVVGYLVLVLGSDVAVVDDVYVTPEARELGFGDAMLAAALEGAQRSGARLFEGSSLPGDRDTKNLYERAGIKARLITVSTVLSPPTAPVDEPHAPR